jgi:hypothetical protein
LGSWQTVSVEVVDEEEEAQKADLFRLEEDEKRMQAATVCYCSVDSNVYVVQCIFTSIYFINRVIFYIITSTIFLLVLGYVIIYMHVIHTG